MNETLEQFRERLQKIECYRQMVIGRAYQGNTRSAFNFDGHLCCLESSDYRTVLDTGKPATPAQMFYVASAEPRDVWVHGEWVKGRINATMLAIRYHGEARPDEYHEDDKNAWYLAFHGERAFENMTQMIYDYKTKVLPSTIFPWLKAKLERTENEKCINHESGT